MFSKIVGSSLGMDRFFCLSASFVALYEASKTFGTWKVLMYMGSA